MVATKLYVFCYLPGALRATPAGLFTHEDGIRVGTFAYGRRYLERQEAVPVDPVALPLGLEPLPVTTNGGLYGAFRDASPDYWGRLVIASCIGRPADSMSEVDFLTHANATRAGNLDFRPALDSPEPVLEPPAFQELSQLLAAAAAIEDGGQVDTHTRAMFEQGTSLGGARPKCTVTLDGELWLAKFPSRYDRFDLPRAEFATMKLAEKCGMHVPETRLEMIGRHAVFLTKRFDREAVEGGWARRAYLSALSLAEWDERDRHLWSYSRLAERMRQYSGSVSADLEELFRRIAFNILVRNTDDHPRNHGFLAQNDGVRLAPLFDVEPSMAQPGVSTEFSLAMSVGPTGRLGSLSNLCADARVYNLTRSAAEKLCDELRDAVANSWEKIFADCGIGKTEQDAFAPTFEGVRHR